MSLDEAQVLIKDALVKDSSGLQLGLNSAQFEDFICNGDDDITIDLKNLRPLTPKDPSKIISARSYHQTEEDK